MVRLISVTALALWFTGLAAGASPLATDACPGITATTTLWKQVGAAEQGDVLENLGFDGLGRIWISNSTKGRVESYDAAGVLRGFFTLASPGALTRGPDGLMYANLGASAAGAVLKTGAAGVVRFDPAAPITDPGAFASVYASGWNMANGGIFDPAGNYYTSNDFDVEVTKILPNGSVDQAWTGAADVWGTNGLVVKGDVLYAAITFDQRSAIERIPLGQPHAHTTAAQTTFGAVSLQPAAHLNPDAAKPLPGVKGLDDMTLGPDGNLWVVANGTGELLRVTPETGHSCLIAGGLRSPSSVRFSNNFGAYSDTTDLFITEFSGAIKHIRLS